LCRDQKASSAKIVPIMKMVAGEKIKYELPKIPQDKKIAA